MLHRYGRSSPKDCKSARAQFCLHSGSYYAFEMYKTILPDSVTRRKGHDPCPVMSKDILTSRLFTSCWDTSVHPGRARCEAQPAKHKSRATASQWHLLALLWSCCSSMLSCVHTPLTPPRLLLNAVLLLTCQPGLHTASGAPNEAVGRPRRRSSRHARRRSAAGLRAGQRSKRAG